MQLRDHPLMIRKSGMKSWPPLWINLKAKHKPRGEVGILQKVSTHPAIDNGLFLWIDYGGSTYVGSLHFDDFAFCDIIRKFLGSKIGLSIKEIGDLDVSFTL